MLKKYHVLPQKTKTQGLLTSPFGWSRQQITSKEDKYLIRYLTKQM